MIKKTKTNNRTVNGILKLFIAHNLNWIFFVHTGLPAIVKNCTFSNQTQISVEIQCIAGYDGGLPQYFVLEMVSVQSGRVR